MNTFELFQELLSNFGSTLSSAKAITSTQKSSLPLEIALIGFRQFSNISEWSPQHTEFISNRLQGELSAEGLSWYGECGEAIAVFSCLALGALLGKFQSGTIDDVGFTLSDAHLAAFIALHNEEICTTYFHQQAMKPH